MQRRKSSVEWATEELKSTFGVVELSYMQWSVEVCPLMMITCLSCLIKLKSVDTLFLKTYLLLFKILSIKCFNLTLSKEFLYKNYKTMFGTKIICQTTFSLWINSKSITKMHKLTLKLFKNFLSWILI